MWNARCVRKVLECPVDERLRIALVEDICVIELHDDSSEEEDARSRGVLSGFPNAISAHSDDLSLLFGKLYGEGRI